jgi:hypothetical protein
MVPRAEGDRFGSGNNLECAVPGLERPRGLLKGFDSVYTAFTGG